MKMKKFRICKIEFLFFIIELTIELSFPFDVTVESKEDGFDKEQNR